MGQLPRLGRSPEGGNGNSFQYSFEQNPKDRGTLWVTVHEIAELFMTEHTHNHSISS